MALYVETNSRKLETMIHSVLVCLFLCEQVHVAFVLMLLNVMPFEVVKLKQLNRSREQKKKREEKNKKRGNTNKSHNKSRSSGGGGEDSN